LARSRREKKSARLEDGEESATGRITAKVSIRFDRYYLPANLYYLPAKAL
jgi:hypothetical protein